MIECKNHTEKTWWITKKNDNSTIHYGEVEVGSLVQSGLDEIETSIIQQDYIDRLIELGIDTSQL